MGLLCTETMFIPMDDKNLVSHINPFSTILRCLISLLLMGAPKNNNIYIFFLRVY